MPFSSHLLEFSKFIVIGIIIGIVFDFFRAYRKINKISNLFVTIQDIIFFIIVLVIMILGIVFILDTEIRFYIFLALFIGIYIYIKFFSKLIMFVFTKIIGISRKILEFIILPLMINFEFIAKIYKFFEKYIKKCCKKFFYMILSIRELFFARFIKQKRSVNNGIRKKKEKKGKNK